MVVIESVPGVHANGQRIEPEMRLGIGPCSMRRTVPSRYREPIRILGALHDNRFYSLIHISRHRGIDLERTQRPC